MSNNANASQVSVYHQPAIQGIEGPLNLENAPLLQQPVKEPLKNLLRARRETGSSLELGMLKKVLWPLLQSFLKNPFQNEGARPLMLPDFRGRFSHSETDSKEILGKSRTPFRSIPSINRHRALRDAC